MKKSAAFRRVAHAPRLPIFFGLNEFAKLVPVADPVGAVVTVIEFAELVPVVDPVDPSSLACLGMLGSTGLCCRLPLVFERWIRILITCSPTRSLDAISSIDCELITEFRTRSRSHAISSICVVAELP